ncbi:MAG: PD-(D/E)XK nuclease family protein [Methanobrevibacter sp.]|nr:PD-(D/E)XK nuclease family protein [Methanobrevibacter sp.]
MKLSSKSKEYNIPEYSLTGDLLSFLTCNLQYRYQNKGLLPPSRPLQHWFGEFIHGVMDEAYKQWKIKETHFPWDWMGDIRPIEEKIDQQMQIRGLYPPNPKYFTHYIDIENSKKIPLKRIISSRVEKSINIWGKHIFPLIDSSEVLIKRLREIPSDSNNEEQSDNNIEKRSDFYCVNGIIDVISSLNISSEISTNNLIIDYLKKEGFYKSQRKSEEYEIIIDYKGMKRPKYDSRTTNQQSKISDKSDWNYHKWQILTYSWLRSRQANSKPIMAGIIFYLNELLPSTKDLLVIKEDIETNKTDLKISKFDKQLIEDWDESEENFPKLSNSFKLDRSIRIIKIDDDEIKKALTEFDIVVNKIEKSTLKENKSNSIKNSWKADGDKRTCDACDFKSFCNKYTDQNSNCLTIP